MYHRQCPRASVQPLSRPGGRQVGFQRGIITGMASILLELLLVFGSIFGITGPSDQAAGTVPTAATGTVVFVYDGDTALARIGTSTIRVRYIGIDTPERDYDNPKAGDCYAEEAAQANRELVQGREVLLVPDREDHDAYGRALRYVYADGVLVNEVLVREGYAQTLMVPPNTGMQSVLARAEAEARAATRGLWGACRSG